MPVAIRILGTRPDRIAISDEDLVALIQSGDEGLLSEPDEMSSHHWLPISRVHHLQRHLESWTGDLPNWISTTMPDAEWASKKAWDGERVAWLLGRNRLVIQSPYALTLVDRLHELSGRLTRSSIINGWIVTIGDDDLDAVSDILDEYEISASVNLNSFLEGRGSWRSILDDIVEDAKKEGFAPLSNFASGRSYKWWQEQAIMVEAYEGDVLLTDQVGLGKGGSFIGGHLSLNKWLEENKGQDNYPIIFSVTKSMKSEIAEEIIKWTEAPRIQIVSGTKREPLEEGMQYYIVNHDILGARLLDILEVKPKGFVADEAHVFKNPESKRTQAAQELADAIRENTRYPYIVMASGTPFLNGPWELWPLLGILGKQGIFAEYAMKRLPNTEMKVHWKVRGKSYSKMQKISPQRAFEAYFCGGHINKYKQWELSGATHTVELNKLLVTEGMIRRRKSDVMHPLPALDESLVMLDWPSEEAEAEYIRKEEEFEEWLTEEVARVAEEEGTSVKEAVQIVKRKLANGAAMMKLTALRQHLAYSKIEGTVQWIHKFMDGSLEVKHGDGHIGPVSDDPDRRKLIVFTHHRDPRQALLDHPDLAQYGVVTILPGGDQTGESIQEHKEMFQRSPDARLMICSFAAREGHTLTAAKDVYLMEIPFVPAWIVQCAGRCWARLSELYEPHEATLHYAVIDNTDDMKALKRVRLKKAAFDAIIDGEGQDESIQEIADEVVDDLFGHINLGKIQLNVAK